MKTKTEAEISWSKLIKELESYYQQAEFWLLNAPQKEEELKRKREDILHSSSGPSYENVVDQSGFSDPTGNKAQRLLEIEREERWIELIREIEQTPFGHIVRLRRHYGRGYRGNPVWRRIAAKIPYSERWVREKWKDVVHYTAFLAVSRGIATKKEAVYLIEEVI